MTEREFINVEEQAYLDTAIYALRQITPKNSEVIDEDNFYKILDDLIHYRKTLNKLIHIE